MAYLPRLRKNDREQAMLAISPYRWETADAYHEASTCPADADNPHKLDVRTGKQIRALMGVIRFYVCHTLHISPSLIIYSATMRATDPTNAPFTSPMHRRWQSLSRSTRSGRQ